MYIMSIMGGSYVAVHIEFDIVAEGLVAGISKGVRQFVYIGRYREEYIG